MAEGGGTRPSWFRFRPSPNDALVLRWVLVITALVQVVTAAIELSRPLPDPRRGAFHLLVGASVGVAALLQTGWGKSHAAQVKGAVLALAALALGVLAWRLAVGP